jgi:adenosine kinase
MTVLSPEAIRDGVSGALLLFGNDYEYAVLKEKTGWSEKEILSHVDAIIVTNGAKGTDIVAKNGTVHVDAAHVDAVVDPTGAGDGHRAGFMKGMVTGLPYDVCAKIGSTIAAYIVEVYGTQSHKFTLEDLKARYKKNYQEELPL